MHETTDDALASVFRDPDYEAARISPGAFQQRTAEQFRLDVAEYHGRKVGHVLHYFVAAFYLFVVTPVKVALFIARNIFALAAVGGLLWAMGFIGIVVWLALKI